MAGNRLMLLDVQGPAGLNYFTRSELAYAEIIKITREQRVLYKTNDTPTDNFFTHEAGTGKITVDAGNPFNFAMLNPDGSRVIEKVQIIYKRPLTIFVPPEGPQQNQ